MRFFIYLIFLSSTIAIAAEKTQILCSHKKVCQLIKSLTKNKNDIDIKLSNNIDEIKNSKLYISTPYNLDPLTKEIVTYRENKNLETIRLYLPSNIIKLYKSSMVSPLEKLSHFWLYPNILCYLERGTIKRLEKLKIKTRKNHCIQYNKSYREFKKTLKLIRPINIKSKHNEISALFHIKDVNFNHDKKNTKTITIETEAISNYSDNLFGEFKMILDQIKKVNK
jgi:hypothetical protein